MQHIATFEPILPRSPASRVDTDLAQRTARSVHLNLATTGRAKRIEPSRHKDATYRHRSAAYVLLRTITAWIELDS